MNPLARTLAKIAALRPTRTTKWSALRSYSTSTATKQWPDSKSDERKTTKEPTDSESETQLRPPAKEFPRPTEIAFQTRVANSVSLMGYVDMPIQSESAPNGKFWAGTVIMQKRSSDSPPFWIPIVFEEDLAYSAACHLKENDHIFIEGKLTADTPPCNATHGQANVQVMVHTLNFVEESSPTKKSFVPNKQESISKPSASIVKDLDAELNPWRRLVNNPQEWWDYRENKLTGSVKPKHPDFKSKDGSRSIWLDSAPEWVLSELEGLKFDTPQKSKQVNKSKGDESWKDLLNNPKKWWDNRLTKTKDKAPDFKHKETGEALWIDSSPAWVKSKLPPLESKQGEATNNR